MAGRSGMCPNEVTSALGTKKLLLADIGNTHFHICNGKDYRTFVLRRGREQIQQRETLLYLRKSSAGKFHSKDNIMEKYL